MLAPALRESEQPDASTGRCRALLLGGKTGTADFRRKGALDSRRTGTDTGGRCRGRPWTWFVSGLDAMGRADFGTPRELFHPDVEWHDQRDLPGARVHFGVEAGLRHFRSVMEDLADYRADLEAVEETPGGDVVACCRFSGVGRASGARVERPAVVAFTMREGKLARAEIFGPGKSPLKPWETGRSCSLQATAAWRHDRNSAQHRASPAQAPALVGTRASELRRPHSTNAEATPV